MKDSRLKIEFNNPNPGYIQRRTETPTPTLQQEESVVGIINRLINDSCFDVSVESVDLLQSFICHYEKLSHHMTTTCGLWATDQPDEVQDPKSLLFQIEF